MKFFSLRRERYLYLVTFADRRSISESYSHADGTDLAEKEITKFLKANSGGATWTADNAGAARRFKRTDGAAEAMYAPVNRRPALTVHKLHVPNNLPNANGPPGPEKPSPMAQGMNRPNGVMCVRPLVGFLSAVVTAILLYASNHADAQAQPRQ